MTSYLFVSNTENFKFNNSFINDINNLIDSFKDYNFNFNIKNQKFP